MISCEKCGAQMDAAVAFCPSCGAENQGAVQAQADGMNFLLRCKARLHPLGACKWCYMVILCSLVLQVLIAGLLDCFQIKMDIPDVNICVSVSLWHETYRGLGVIMVLILLGALAAVAAPLFGKLPLKSWNLNTAAAASGGMMIVTLWMYWDFIDTVFPAEFTFFGYLLIVASLTTIILSYLVNKALTKKRQ